MKYKFLNLNNNYLSLYLGIAISSVFLIKKYFTGPYVNNNLKKKNPVNNKIVIITGCTAGIGKVTAIDLLKNGATVIFACRNKDKTMSIINSLEENIQKKSIFMELDLSSFKSVKKFVDSFKKQFNKLDILINNAGSVFDSYKLTEDNIESTLQVNTLSHMYLTQELFELLSKSNNARIINVASRAHTRVNFKDDFYNKYFYDKKSNENIEYKNNAFYNFELEKNNSYYSMLKNYQLSKLGNIYFSQYINEYLQNNGINNVKSFSLHPGVIFTDFFFNHKYKYLMYIINPFVWLFLKTNESGAQTSLYLCYEDFNNIASGGYYKDCKLNKEANHAKYSNTENRKLFMDFAISNINYYGKKSNISINLI